MQIKSICILGGTGFVGSQLAWQLAARGISVRILTRNRDRHKHMLVVPGITLIDADIYDARQLRAHFLEVDAVINLVGILNESTHDGSGFRRVHSVLPKLILEQCIACNVHRLLHMSALNADAQNGPSHYLRSKGEGEDIIHNHQSGILNVTSFRASVIFGEQDSFFNRFANLLKITPLFFPLACPNARFAPVFVGDVVARFIKALNDRSSFGKRYDICGPVQYSLIELVRYTAEQLGVKRMIIGLPDSLGRLQATLFEWLPGKPFSLDNYNSLKVDSICPQGISEPTSIESVVPYYIGHKGKTDRFADYRSRARR